VRHVGTIAPVLSGLAHWSAAPTASSTGPFPLFFSHDRGVGRYRCHSIGAGGRCGNSPQMRVAMANLFPVVRPWKECVVYFPDPLPWRPISPDLARYSVERANRKAPGAKQCSPEVKPAVWKNPARTKPIDPSAKFLHMLDDELNDPERLDKDYLARLIKKKYITEEVYGLTWPTEERVYNEQQEAELERAAGYRSQIKYDAGPFWTRKGRWTGLWPAPVSAHWHYIQRETIPESTDANLTEAFSVTLYYAGLINKHDPHLCGAAGDACRSYQAATVFRGFWSRGLRISVANMVHAFRVIEAFEKHLRQDRKITWTRLTAILDVLEGDSFRTAAEKHGIDHTSLYQWFKDEVPDIEREFGRYCLKWQPPQKRPAAVYNGSKKRRPAQKPRVWRMSPAEREKQVADYLAKARATKSWLTDNLIEWLCHFCRTTELHVLIRYPKLRAIANEAYQAIAEYLKQGGKIIKAGAVYNGDAPYRKDKRSREQVLIDRFGAPPGPDPFEIFERRKSRRLRDDVEYGVDEKISGTPLF
jgi:hypothetical protein